MAEFRGPGRAVRIGRSMVHGSASSKPCSDIRCCECACLRDVWRRQICCFAGSMAHGRKHLASAGLARWLAGRIAGAGHIPAQNPQDGIPDRFLDLGLREYRDCQLAGQKRMGGCRAHLVGLVADMHVRAALLGQATDFSGSEIVTSSPPPSALRATIEPPWRAIARCAMARPRPVPPLARVRALSVR